MQLILIKKITEQKTGAITHIIYAFHVSEMKTLDVCTTFENKRDIL